MSTSKITHDTSQILFWEFVLEKELSGCVALLDEKERSINYFLDIPFEHQTEANYRTIKRLEKDIAVFKGSVLALIQMKEAYVEFTASVASKLVKLSAECEYYQRRIDETNARHGAPRI